MQVNDVKISEIKAYSNNAKRHDEDQIQAIANSIKQFGFRQPIVLDKNNEIVIGHGRLEAAKTLGMESVPCITAEDLTEDQIKALRIADNKLSEKGTWDNDALGEELKAIADAIDMTDFGFGEFELTILTGDFEPVQFEKEETEEYDEREEDFLVKKRVIINYEDNQEDLLRKLLHIEDGKKIKVVYDISEVIGE